MAYVSCKYGPPPDPISQQMIICVDEDGQEWWLTEDNKTGDWLRFQENGGTVDPYEPPEEAA